MYRDCQSCGRKASTRYCRRCLRQREAELNLAKPRAEQVVMEPADDRIEQAMRDLIIERTQGKPWNFCAEEDPVREQLIRAVIDGTERMEVADGKEPSR